MAAARGIACFSAELASHSFFFEHIVASPDFALLQTGCTGDTWRRTRNFHGLSNHTQSNVEQLQSNYLGCLPKKRASHDISSSRHSMPTMRKDLEQDTRNRTRSVTQIIIELRVPSTSTNFHSSVKTNAPCSNPSNSAEYHLSWLSPSHDRLKTRLNMLPATFLAIPVP